MSPSSHIRGFCPILKLSPLVSQPSETRGEGDNFKKFHWYCDTKLQYLAVFRTLTAQTTTAMVRARRYDDDETVKRFREMLAGATTKKEIRAKCADQREWRAVKRRLKYCPSSQAFALKNSRRKPGKSFSYPSETSRKILNMMIHRIVNEAILPHSPAENHVKGAARELFADIAMELANHPSFRPRYPFNANCSMNLVPGSCQFMKRIRKDHPKLYAQVIKNLEDSWSFHRGFTRALRSECGCQNPCSRMS